MPYFISLLLYAFFLDETTESRYLQLVSADICDLIIGYILYKFNPPHYQTPSIGFCFLDLRESCCRSEAGGDLYMETCQDLVQTRIPVLSIY